MLTAVEFNSEISAARDRFGLEHREHRTTSEREDFDLLVELLRTYPFIRNDLERRINLRLMASTIADYLESAKSDQYPPRVTVVCKLAELIDAEVRMIRAREKLRAQQNWKMAVEQIKPKIKAEQNWKQLRKLRSPEEVGGARGVIEEYWQEIFDPLHRNPREVQLQYKKDEWLAMATPGSKEYDPKFRQTFFEYLDAAGEKTPINYKYLQTKAERDAYEIEVRGDSLVKKVTGGLLDTAKMKITNQQVVSGVGIWVMSPEQRIYSGGQCENVEIDSRGIEHVFDMHHSGFLASAPVLGAGEWEVAKGKLKVITASSGHYQPTFKNFTDAMAVLVKRGIDLGSVAAGWDTSGTQTDYFNARQLAMPGVKAEWCGWPHFLNRPLQPVERNNPTTIKTLPERATQKVKGTPFEAPGR